MFRVNRIPQTGPSLARTVEAYRIQSLVQECSLLEEAEPLLTQHGPGSEEAVANEIARKYHRLVQSGLDTFVTAMAQRNNRMHIPTAIETPGMRLCWAMRAIGGELSAQDSIPAQQAVIALRSGRHYITSLHDPETAVPELATNFVHHYENLTEGVEVCQIAPNPQSGTIATTTTMSDAHIPSVSIA